jgi:hypothetical protein
MTRRSGAATLLAMALVGVAVLSGCASTGTARREHVVSSMDDTRTYVDRSKTQIAATMAALNALPGKSGDALTAQYKQFVNEYNKTESLANETSRRAAGVRANAEKQLKAWQDQAATIQDPDLRRRAEAQRSEHATQYEVFSSDMLTADRSLQTFLTDLRDIKTYLDLDLTQRGVDAVQDKIAKANTDSKSAVTALNTVNESINTLSANLQP